MHSGSTFYKTSFWQVGLDMEFNMPKDDFLDALKKNVDPPGHFAHIFTSTPNAYIGSVNDNYIDLRPNLRHKFFHSRGRGIVGDVIEDSSKTIVKVKFASHLALALQMCLAFTLFSSLSFINLWINEKYRLESACIVAAYALLILILILSYPNMRRKSILRFKEYVENITQQREETTSA